MKVVVGQTRRMGKGLFAAEKLRRGETIFVARGPLVRRNSRTRFRVGARWLAIGKDSWIAPPQSNLWWFINHSCRPNAGIRGRVIVVALHQIRPGEEVTIDYGITEADPFYRLGVWCRCKSKECRKFIGGIQTLPRNAFVRYLPFVPKFIQAEWKRRVSVT